MTNEPGTPKRLNPWNPLDHLRLLWWALVMPQRLVQYTEMYGEKAERDTGKWLVGTLVWLPFLVPLISLMVGILPSSDTSQSSSTLLWVAAGCAVAWGLTGWLGDRDDYLTGFSLLLLAIPMMQLGKRSISFDVASGLAACLALGLVVPVARAIAGAVAQGVSAFAVLFVVLDVTRAAFGRVMGIVVAVILLSVGSQFLRFLDSRLRAGRPSRLMQVLFIALTVAQVLLIWHSLLGGWRVLR